MEYVNPVALDEQTCLKIIQKIHKRKIINADDLTAADMFRLTQALCPHIDKAVITNGKSNYSKLKEGTLAKEYPRALCQVFLECIWWETHGSWSHDDFTARPAHSRGFYSERKRLRSFLKSQDDRYDEMALAEQEFENKLESNNLMSKSEHFHEMDAKDKIIEQLQEQHEKEMSRMKFTLDKQINTLTMDRNRFRTLYEAQTTGSHPNSCKVESETSDEDDASGVGLIESES